MTTKENRAKQVAALAEDLFQSPNFYISEQSDKLENFDGPVSDFVVGYKLRSARGDHALGVSIYLDTLSISIDQTYFLRWRQDENLQTLTEALNNFINIATSTGIEERTYYLLGLKIGAQIFLPSSIDACLERKDVAKGLVFLKGIARTRKSNIVFN